MLIAGIIGKPHGLSGEVYVRRVSDDPRRFAPGSVLTHEDGRSLTVASSRHHRDRFLVLFEEVADRSGAERLRGNLFVDDSERRSLETGEYWTSDLEGARVILTDGTAVGVVTAVREGPAQDLLEVETPSGPRFVPVVEAIVLGVDVEAGTVTIDPPEGLLS